MEAMELVRSSGARDEEMDLESSSQNTALDVGSPSHHKRSRTVLAHSSLACTRVRVIRLSGLLVAAVGAILLISLMVNPHVAHTGPSPARALSRTGASLEFPVVGDWGRMGSWNQRNVAEEMGLAADKTSAPFVISTGDNIYPSGVASVDDPQFQQSWGTVYTNPALKREWLMTLGNHDSRGDCQAQVEFSKKDPFWRMDGRFYSVTKHNGTVLLVFLDTNPFVARYRDAFHTDMAPCLSTSQPVSAQLAWLEATLAASTAAVKVVVGHHAIYSGGKHGNTAELQPLVPIMRRHGVVAYLCGHDHHMEHVERDGMHFFVSGAGSKTRPPHPINGSQFASGESGFLFVSVLPPQDGAGGGADGGAGGGAGGGGGDGVVEGDGGVAGAAGGAGASGVSSTTKATSLWQFIDQRGNLLYEKTVMEA